MITIKKTKLTVKREPLLAPFGFKGGFVDELWQTTVAMEDEEGRVGEGLSVQSVLWSDPRVYAEWGHERGNAFMRDIALHALSAVAGVRYETPLDLLDALTGSARAYATRQWTGKPLRGTFALNALVAADHAAWALLSRRRPGERFVELIPEAYRAGLTWRHERIASAPVVSYGMTDADVEALLDDGSFVLKIKLGSDPEADGDPEKMLAWDIERLRAVHRLAGERECPHTANGSIAYYLDINGRYGTKEQLWRLVEAADRMGALERILLLEEPFPEEVRESVADIPVRVVADESVHGEEDALERIRLGYGAFALKPVAKTMSLSLKIAKLAGERGIPCFCADLTGSPVMVDWNKNLAALLPPLPGLTMGLIETNGRQNYREWEAMKRRHPAPDGGWIPEERGIFRLGSDFYEQSGGVFALGDIRPVP
ncbi:enolase C-terminal domain-like protein [Paenibacillus antri]|uniref:enolase C-terminal domain-like protein n=1 Tax=Paenibacillus antri TaxID=2582848 RepID=UPI0013051FE7|nr:enolase C-terminal domain-like protein [Paenibacillus antri]